MNKPRVKSPNSKQYEDTLNIVRNLKLVTVCEEAACPNISECWSKRHAAFMILGDICTRWCRFCNVKTGRPKGVDILEPKRVAKAINEMKLKHVVITSVDRDDLEDGGANHFAKTICETRKLNPNTTIEVLTPDFLDKKGALEIVISAKPDVFNHNLETVPRLYKTVRPKAQYKNSINLLKNAKIIDPKINTKSGLMVGLGETDEELYEVMDDLRKASVDFLTIGQYLRPTKKHHPVIRYATYQDFLNYKNIGEKKGFLYVASGALVRSSYHKSLKHVEKT